jgi:hypothetical protein
LNGLLLLLFFLALLFLVILWVIGSNIDSTILHVVFVNLRRRGEHLQLVDGSTIHRGVAIRETNTSTDSIVEIVNPRQLRFIQCVALLVLKLLLEVIGIIVSYERPRPWINNSILLLFMILNRDCYWWHEIRVIPEIVALVQSLGSVIT